jgi:hypothetical protein
MGISVDRQSSSLQVRGAYADRGASVSSWLPIGSAKGGADFELAQRSEAHIVCFCQSFMIEVYRSLRERTDLPAGAIVAMGRAAVESSPWVRC